MVLLGRAVTCSHRLSIQTTVVSGTVWPQFAMQVLTIGVTVVSPQFVENVVVGLKMGSLSNRVVTSYPLPIVNVGLSLTVFAVLQLVKDRRTDGETEEDSGYIFCKCHCNTCLRSKIITTKQ